MRSFLKEAPSHLLRDRKSPAARKEPQNKAHAGDAAVVSIVRGGRRVGSFAESQQLAEGAPLMRMPFCGLKPGYMVPDVSQLDVSQLK